MVGASIRIIARLARLDTCALIFLSVFLPTYYHTGAWVLSLTQTFPLVPTCVCGFILNDLRDIERDRENHPDRPLPSGSISELAASLLYFISLFLALAAIKIFVELAHLFLYMVILLLFANYNYLVDYAPMIKNVYVAVTGLVLVCLVAELNDVINLPIVAASTFLFILGREILMDVQDINGDTATLAKRIGSRAAENVSFALQFLGILFLLCIANDLIGYILVALILVIDCIIAFLWRNDIHRPMAIHTMKLQLLFGIYFLIGTAG